MISSEISIFFVHFDVPSSTRCAQYCVHPRCNGSRRYSTTLESHEDIVSESGGAGVPGEGVTSGSNIGTTTAASGTAVSTAESGVSRLLGRLPILPRQPAETRHNSRSTDSAPTPIYGGL